MQRSTGNRAGPVAGWHACELAALAMKKPIQRAILLEDVLSDFLEVEDILLQLKLKDALRPLTRAGPFRCT